MTGRDQSAGRFKALPALAACGSVILLGYVGLFALLQSPVLWYALRPDPIRSLFPGAFGPINSLFPDRWVNLERTDPLALLVVPLFVVVLTLVTVPLVYLLHRLAGNARERYTGRQVRAFVAVALLFTLAVMLVLLLVRGILSTDVYSYAWYSRILAVHGASPMTHAPQEFPPDPEGAFYWIGWPDEPSVYGPVWTAVSTAFFSIGLALKGTFSAELLSLRVLADLAHLLNALLVWSIAGLLTSRSVQLRHRPRALARFGRAPWRRGRIPAVPEVQRRGEGVALGPRAAAFIFYLWNPLLLIEFAGSGHNDVLMLTFVLLAVWLHLKGAWPLAAAALALATLVKLPALFLIPGYLWYLFWIDFNKAAGLPRHLRRASAVVRPIASAAVIGLTAIILYLPFWEGTRTLVPPFAGPASRLYLHSLAFDIWWNGPQISADVLGVRGGRTEFIESVRAFLNDYLHLFFTAVLGVVAVVLTWGARTFPRLLISWGWSALFAAILQGWYWPWYASWSIALAAIAPSRRLRVATMVLAISSLMLYPEEQILARHFPLFLDWSGVFVVLPVLLYIAISWLRSRKRAQVVHRLPDPAEGRAHVHSRPGA